MGHDTRNRHATNTGEQVTQAGTSHDLKGFFAGGAAAAKFEDRAFGTVIGGEIVEEPRMQQQRDYESNEPLYYQDGNPQMQMVVVVQAQPATSEDDGRRAFYIKGQLRQAVGEALRKVGADVPERGGKLWVKYTEDKETTLKNGRRGNPQKIYVAKYEAPAQVAGGAYFDEPAAAALGQRLAQAGAPVAVSGPGALACPEGVDAGRWADMSRDQQQQLHEALGLAAPATAGAGASFAGEPPF